MTAWLFRPLFGSPFSPAGVAGLVFAVVLVELARAVMISYRKGC